MKKNIASRNGTTVCLPKNSNAYMLLLEFFRGQIISIMPKALDTSDNHTSVSIYMHVDVLDELVDYINSNI